MSRARKLLFADGIMPTKESYSAMRAAQKMRALLEEYMARENVPLAIALQELHDKGLLADLEYRQKRAMLTACAIREESEGAQRRCAAEIPRRFATTAWIRARYEKVIAKGCAPGAPDCSASETAGSNFRSH
jgi:hypothetical protein